MATLSVTEAARQIGVSTATVRNWAKAGHIEPVPGDRLSFDEGEVSRVKADLASGRLGRLRSRANKTKSDTRFVPTEYADSDNIFRVTSQLYQLQANNCLSKESLLFFAALRRLERAGDVNADSGMLLRDQPAQCFDRLTWRRECVRNEMQHWYETLTQKPDDKTCTEIAAQIGVIDGIDANNANNSGNGNGDDLGFLYQALFDEGGKLRAGSYYTPTQYVRDSLRWAGIKPNETLLDPCCGTGKYLVTALRHFALRPEHCYGFDIDPLAVRLARVNLFLAAPNCEFVPNICCCNALTDELSQGHIAFDAFFDVIATNPPWGADKNTGHLSNSKPRFRESFALFLVKSLSLLKPDGRLSFLLPEAFLNIKKHAEIRKLVLTQTAVHSVSELGRGFSGVYTGATRLDLVKAKPPPGHYCRVTNVDGQKHEIEQTAFLQNRDCVFDVAVTSNDRAILEKIFATPHVTLADKADWALGIVTGNNAKHIAKTPIEGGEPIFRGSNVEAYHLHKPTQYIRFEPALYQQIAPEAMYRAPEKLVYKFISKKLVFAYDAERHLTLNSANVLIPRLPEMSVKVTAAFLNSTLFQYVFEKKFATHKVLRGDLELLPFPVISRATHDVIEAHIARLIAPPKEMPTVLSADTTESACVVNELEQLVFACFPALTNADISHITKGPVSQRGLRKGKKSEAKNKEPEA